MSPSVLANRPRLARIAVACAVLLALVGYVVTHVLTGGGGPPRCSVRADGQQVLLEPEQAENAATIEAVASARGLPERAVTIALATALQESGLRNVRHGDRDSVGLFQQRPSQGWGTAKQIQDPVYAAGKFYDNLVKVPGYSRLPLTVAAQRVQHSGYPQAYAKHEPEATELTAAFVGRERAAVSCPGPPDDGASGDPSRVRAQLKREFGSTVVPSAGSQSSDGHAGTPAHAVVIPLRSPSGQPPGPGDGSGSDPARRGWEVAHWAVAHADALHIESVTYGDREWRAKDSGKGWQRVKGDAATDVRLDTVR